MAGVGDDGGRKVECVPGMSWDKCGYSGAVVTTDQGGKALAMGLQAGQAIQPHACPMDVVYSASAGTTKLFTWIEPQQGQPPFVEFLRSSDKVTVPANMVCALWCEEQSQLERTTIMDAPDSPELGPSAVFQGIEKGVVGADGELRVVDPEVVEAFNDRVVAVTGCSRGLGLELAHQLVAAGAIVIATCRSPGRAPGLEKALKHCSKSSQVLACNVSDEASIAGLAAAIASTHPDGIDMLINNAGISSPNHPFDPVLSTTKEVMMSVYSTNVVGTVLLTQALLPSLRSKIGGSKIIMNMSSQLGSIANCFGCQGKYGGVASYRMSRAANNMAARTFAGELKDEDFKVVAMSPGHVATDMGNKGGRTPPLTPIKSISGILKVMSGLTTADNGRFLQYDGQELPW